MSAGGQIGQLGQLSLFGLPTHEWEVIGDSHRAGLHACPHHLCLDRAGLPLDVKRLEISRGEAGPRAGQQLGGRQDLPRLGLGHETSRQIDRVPHHGEGPSVGGTHLADEDRPAVHADADG